MPSILTACISQNRKVLDKSKMLRHNVQGLGLINIMQTKIHATIVRFAGTA